MLWGLEYSLRSIQMIRETSALKGHKDVVECSLQRVEKEAKDKAAGYQHEDPESEEAHAVIDLQRVVWQKVPENAAAVERREGNKVEDKKQQIDQDDEVEQKSYGKESWQIFSRDSWIVHRQRHRREDSHAAPGNDMLDDEEQYQRDRRQQKITDRTGDRDEDVVTGVVFEISRSYRRRFSPAEEWPVVDQGEKRHQHGTPGVEVLHRIQRDAAQHAGCRIAQPPSSPGVRTLVHAKGKDQGNNLKEDKDKVLIHDDSSLPKLRPWPHLTTLVTAKDCFGMEKKAPYRSDSVLIADDELAQERCDRGEGWPAIYRN